MLNLTEIDRQLAEAWDAIENVILGCLVRDRVKRMTNSIRVKKSYPYYKKYPRTYIPKERKAKFATCHPEKKHHARGLCKYCYKRMYRILHSKTGQPRVTRFSICHPERKHYIHGQCCQCWNRDRMRRYRHEKAA